MSMDTQRKVYRVNVTITETRYAKALVEAESEEDAEDAVRSDPEALEYGATDQDVDVAVIPDFLQNPTHGAVAGALLDIESDAYSEARKADQENPQDELTLPLFIMGNVR